MTLPRLRRYILFVVALFINAFGIAFITKALLGTSPITSITYVLSMFTALTMGEWTILVNLLFVVLELPLMSRKQLHDERFPYLMQIPISLCFGYFIDGSMFLLQGLAPVSYLAQFISLLIGCTILALGIALEVKVNVAMAAGEYFVRVITLRFKGDFGYIKLGFDSTLVLLSCIVSWIFMQGIYGVREGTVIAALVVGPIVHFVSPYYRFLDRWITDSAHPAETMPSRPESSPAAHPTIITIARELGSGGHQLGEMLAHELDIKLYDKEFIELAAQRSGLDEEYIRRNEQSIPSFWLKCLYAQDYKRSLSPDDVLFVAESSIIRDLANRESCIIIGRCADFVLGDTTDVIRLFCYADATSACHRCIHQYGIAADQVDTERKRINHNRRMHYEFYTGRRWDDPHHYDLMVNTSRVSLETICQTVCRLYHTRNSRQLQANG